MKLLLIFVHLLSATELSYSPILTHFLCSNGYMSSSDDIKSPSNTALAQIKAKAQENTRLISSKAASPDCDKDLHSAEHNCFRNVLAHVNGFNHNQILFQKAYNNVKSINEQYFLLLYWSNKDLDFLLSIKPYKNMGLSIVLQGLNGKATRLRKEYEEVLLNVPIYSRLIMRVYKAHRLPAPPLPALDVKWGKANASVGPKVLYSLLTNLVRHKFIVSDSIAPIKEYFASSNQELIKNDGRDESTTRRSIPNALVKHLDLFDSVSNGWFAFWLLGMRIRRPMPSPTESALGPSLLEGFNLEIKAMGAIMKEDDEKTRKYALKFSCLHIDYLIACMHLTLAFNLLNHQNHANCIALLLNHRTLALDMINKLVPQKS